MASIYNQISKNANKVTLIYFDDKDTPTIKRVIDTLKKKKFSGKVEVISFLNKESRILKNSFAKKDWSDTNYYNLDDISELVSYDGEKKTKSEVIKIFLKPLNIFFFHKHSQLLIVKVIVPDWVLIAEVLMI